MYTILLTSGASRKSLAIARSLKLAGYRVVALFHRHHPFVYSHLFDSMIRVEVKRGTRRYARAIAFAAMKSRADLVIPLDFADVYTVSKYAELIKRIAVPAVPLYDAVVKASNKLSLPQTMSEVGVPTPKTIAVVNEEDLKGIYSLSPPFVVKGVGDAARPEYLPSHEMGLDVAKNRIPCIVQEFIPGSGHGYYTVAVEGRPYLEFAHRRVVELDPIGGPSMMACSYYDPTLMELGRKIIKHLNWTGPIMVEFRKNPEKRTYFVIELNPKFWGSIDLPITLGYHFPVVLAEYYLKGAKAAEMFVKNLKVDERGCFAWVIDSIRYLAKDSHTWFHMAEYALSHVHMTDVDPSDQPRIVAQLAVALRRIKLEKKKAIALWLQDRLKISWWLKEAVRRTREGRIVLSIDLDGTLTTLKVDWRSVRRLLVQHGFINEWEGVMEGLCRLWDRDRERYEEASRIIEEFEIEAARNTRVTREIVRVREALTRLKDKVSKISLVTRQTKRTAELVLEKLGLEDVFDHLVTRDLEIRRKKQLETIVGSAGNSVLFHIGDTLGDVVATYQVGGLPLHKATKRYKLTQAFRLGAPATYSLYNLLEFLEKLLARSKVR